MGETGDSRGASLAMICESCKVGVPRDMSSKRRRVLGVKSVGVREKMDANFSISFYVTAALPKQSLVRADGFPSHTPLIKNIKPPSHHSRSHFGLFNLSWYLAAVGFIKSMHCNDTRWLYIYLTTCHQPR